MVVKTVTETIGTTEIPPRSRRRRLRPQKEAERVRNHLEKLPPERTINYRPLDR